MPRGQRAALPWWPRGKSRGVLASSPNLRLTALRLEDGPDFVESIDEEVIEWQGFLPGNIARFHEHYAQLVAARFRGRPTQLAVRDPLTDEFLGSYSYSQDYSDYLADTVILGWWLAPHARGRGLGHESLQLVLRWLHDEALIGTVRIGTRADNVRALAQIRTCGARFVAEHPTPLPNGTSPLGKWFVHEL